MATDKSVMAVIRAGRPTFRNQNDKIAFAVHASFLASGYILTATGPQALNDTAFYNSSNDEVSIDQWNELNDEYAFIYANPEKGLKKVLLKCVVMNENLIVDGLAEGSSEPAHFVINVEEYAGEDGGNNYSQQFKNLEKLVKSIDAEILSKLDGSTAKASSSSNRSSETNDRTRQGIYEPGAGFGGLVAPPNHPSGIILPPVPSGSGSDLFPGPGAGMYPTRGDPGFGGSMLFGPNDPRWLGGGGPAFHGGQPGVPPGARFDPYGPPGVPGFEPNRFARNPPRPGYDGHPDLQHFRRDADSDYI
ncbi:PREDICTED: probable proteasome inhibitor [Lupinus angustifolius]|uniref:probable proteasome inhibitor n=1 Tax=Lupinus angustifolius TaxID=3871 RepID=UPI00092E9E1D|nr:PREDICTED: probable proteasome inhibitor [Lupinus angustifolius]XP_019459459.1 PREDICTED: probable proteasome inhibitor [Lupinus angustifolius]